MYIYIYIYIYIYTVRGPRFEETNTDVVVDQTFLKYPQNGS